MQHPQEQQQAPTGVVAVGQSEAEAFRAAGLDCFELAHELDWIEIQAVHSEASTGQHTPLTPIRADLLTWARYRTTVIVSMPAGLSRSQQELYTLAAQALRVQNSAAKVVLGTW